MAHLPNYCFGCIAGDQQPYRIARRNDNDEHRHQNGEYYFDRS
jgi:hypothetical protein